ncbi:MAG: T9SS type A sorting domain-containing protein [Bacteroidetes bacterium]|nr:T9SS type A sorting domain-containing protein [Bacteroidota bacterium]MBU1720629.1 T9SS type A sorting domain-containing protein [Bacteroidota bacterium]
MKRITLFAILAAFALSVSAQNPRVRQAVVKQDAQKSLSATSEISPNAHQTTHATQTRATWLVQFNLDVSSAGAGQAGCETDGTNFYATMWGSDTIIKYDLAGALVEKFQIPGVTGLRDLAYDGTYFYGGAAAGSFFVMNFTTKTLVKTVTCPAGVTVRSIAYDPLADAFWVANWGTTLSLVDTMGVYLDSIPAANHGLTNMYGSAYDGWTTGGPYLWIFDQGGNSNDIVQIDLTTKLPTGLVHDATTDVGVAGDNSAAGLFTHQNLIPGTVTLGGLMQGTHKIFGYNLSELNAAKNLYLSDITSPSNDTTCELTAAENVIIEVTNEGADTVFTFDASYTVNGGSVTTETVNDTILSGEVFEYSFTATVDLSVGVSFDINAWVDLAGDVDSTNDAMEITVYNATALLELTISTDTYGEETSWQLVSAADGSIVAEGSGYGDTTTYVIPICADASACYNFKFYDSYGDGILDGGGFELTWNDTLVVSNYAFDADSVIVNFIGSCDGYDSIAPQSWAIYTDQLVPAGSTMPLGVPVTDMSEVTLVRAIYTLNAVVDSVDLAEGTTPGNWEGIIPAQGAAVTGTVKFYMEDEWGNFGTSSDYDIQWVVTDSFTLDFESSANFSVNFSPWTMNDVDQTPTYGINGVTFTHSAEALAFLAFNPAATTPAMTDANIQPHGGERFGACIAANGAQNNDWLISPKLTLNQDHRIRFWARSYVDTYGLEKFFVSVSTTDTQPGSFTVISGTDTVAVDTLWTQFSYDLSSYTGQSVHVAIQCVSNDAFIFMVDDISIEVSSGIPSIDESQFRVYPNPANDVLNVVAPYDFARVDIINSTGQVVFSGKELNNIFHINTSEFNSGMYFIRMTMENGVVTKRFAVTK